MKRRALTYVLYAAALALIALAVAVTPRLRHRGGPSALAVAPLPPPPLPPPAPPQVAPPPSAPIVQAPPPPKPEPPIVELVFALDTTGSMEGLIDGAKRKIWSIVNFVASGQPRPRVRVGLVGYRDLGDEYVTRFYDLSDDMDEVFEHLSSFRADGGGDTPEHVARALHDAVSRTHWTQDAGNRRVARVIYLVGDAPPHTDYHDGYDYLAIARKAAAKGIHLNAILCGGDGEADRAFRTVARLGGGQFAAIEQDGGVAEVRTPYDRKLAALDAKLAGTAIGYGRGAGLLGARMAAAATAPASIAADRASYAAKMGKAVFSRDDLVEASAGAGGLARIKAEELPPEIAKLPPAERERVVAAKRAERERTLDEIKKVSAARDTFLRAEEGKMGHPAFDDRVRKSLVDETRGMLKY